MRERVSPEGETSTIIELGDFAEGMSYVIDIVTCRVYCEDEILSAKLKLKKGFVLGKKLEEASLINQQFKDGANRVYAGMRIVLANDEESERPRNVNSGKRNEQGEETMFVDIEEARRFWKELWEGDGTGDGSAEWLHDLRAIINDRVPCNRTSPLSDYNRVVASNQFALPVLGYLMWTHQ